MNIKLINERDKNLNPFEQVLRNRGINKTEKEFFDLSWDCVNDPYNLDYMYEGLNMYEHHIEKGSKIAILVDVDVDGYTSAAILVNYTNAQRLYGDWQYDFELVPVFHNEKIHGLEDRDVMRRIRDEIKPDLFVIPDASGTKEQYKALTDLGIDILVLDHHDTKEKGEDNDKVVVINNQHSQKYTNKDFSGAGIVWQFCRAMDDRAMYVGAEDFIDLVALGNISDVMDLRSDETRFLCSLGIKNDYISSPLINYMKMSDYSMKNSEYNPHVVAFNIAPMFNAVCRIGNEKEREILFDCLIKEKANTMVPSGKRGHTGEMVPLVEEGYRLATNTRGRQNLRKEKLLEMIEEVISEEKLFTNKVIILAFDDFKEEYRALSGLVANGLLEFYDRPIILTFKTKDGNYTGSLRAPSNIQAFNNFRKQCEASGLCTFVAGHPQAAGIGIKGGCVQALQDYFNEKYQNIDTEIHEKVDFIFDAEDPELPEIIEYLAKYKNVWGTDIEEPVFAIKNVKISQSTMTLCGDKKTTLKISSTNFELINFKSSQTEYDSLKLPYEKIEQYYPATMICHDPDVNTFRGISTPQLKYTAYKLDSPKYDF